MSIVLAGAYGVFQTTSHSIEVVEAEGELTQTARIVLGDLRRELGSIYPLRVPVDENELDALGDQVSEAGALTFAGEDAEDDEGRPLDNLRFTAVVPGAREGQAGFDIAEIVYQIDIDELTPEVGLVRLRNDHPGLALDAGQGPRTEPLTPLATSFNVRYWAGDQLAEGEALSAEDAWVDEWSDPNMLPAAIEISLGLTPDHEDATERVFSTVVRIPIREPKLDVRSLNLEEGAPTDAPGAPEEGDVPPLPTEQPGGFGGGGFDGGGFGGGPGGFDAP